MSDICVYILHTHIHTVWVCLYTCAYEGHGLVLSKLLTCFTLYFEAGSLFVPRAHDLGRLIAISRDLLVSISSALKLQDHIAAFFPPRILGIHTASCLYNKYFIETHFSSLQITSFNNTLETLVMHCSIVLMVYCWTCNVDCPFPWHKHWRNLLYTYTTCWSALDPMKIRR